MGVRFCPIVFLASRSLACSFVLPFLNCHASSRGRRLLRDENIKRNGDQSSGSMLTWQYPSMIEIKRWFGGRYSFEESASSRCDEWCNHLHAGMTLPVETASLRDHGAAGEIHDVTKHITQWPLCSSHPNGSWRKIRLCSSIGRGVQCYQKCRDAALAWEFQGKSKGMISVPRPCETRQKRRTPESTMRQLLLTYSKVRLLFSWCLYVLNPVAVIYNKVDMKAKDYVYTATAYCTMHGHWLRGEERVCVRYSNVTDAVELEIISFSKPARSIMGYLVWPFIGRMQLSFFDQQAHELKMKITA